MAGRRLLSTLLPLLALATPASASSSSDVTLSLDIQTLSLTSDVLAFLGVSNSATTVDMYTTGTAATTLQLTSLVALPEVYNGVALDKVTFAWSSASNAYFEVSAAVASTDQDILTVPQALAASSTGTTPHSLGTM